MVVSTNFGKDLKEIIELEKYKEKFIYNADETGLFWRSLPRKPLTSGIEKSASGTKLMDQTDENRLGLSLGCKVDAVALTNQTFRLFGPLKEHLRGKHFADDDHVQHEVLLWMRQQPKEFYAAGIGALIKRWHRCINIGGDYAEK
ncbi:hypothetical protein AVEN_113225-1 [Araneus ventricosus]|uniref:DDE-1 domain-containing protein n=1 Tax=Araneus ventricosus TaxID=182803 RepID=A0A4Y2J7T4_ARAVE|nr:hypothetical protein AVEN_98541-1 [Araneus ventricosus]GBM86175.1 hypothetical protein AVEN_72668-1 [Araneus ventricosus]GBM86187.1 hypothetical protein AVEN_110774-1 [Araneus ventricosus]GBM86192.1 hypothetical protein AVEN_113225-1 [Araneus ventricosus]